MNIDAFMKHWGLVENPFRAEEARHDPVLERLSAQEAPHPEFEKIIGRPDQPSASVVFGEKGAGKTAIRLMLEKAISKHNEQNPDKKAWVVRYDDLNPVLDRFAHTVGGNQPGKVLKQLALKDHQDAIISKATTDLVDQLLSIDADKELVFAAKKMPKEQRVDLAHLAAIYDQPSTGTFRARFERLQRLLKLRFMNWYGILLWLVIIFGLGWVGLIGFIYWNWEELASIWYKDLKWLGTFAGNVVLGLSVILASGYLIMRWVQYWILAFKSVRDVRSVHRSISDVHDALAKIPYKHVIGQPIPWTADSDSRYQLTHRLLGVLKAMDYSSLIVLVDRVDEPVMVNGEADLMQHIIWPMLNNKFLQQEGVGMKLLLPLELRHALQRESADFFQKARLDKQHMIDRLEWSGSMLYDVCSHRIQACRSVASVEEQIYLRDLFEDDVTKDSLVDALDQMSQPRDAFKFVYRVIQEHCSNVTEDQQSYKIPSLVLQTVRKQQSRRVQELGRGLSPN